MQARRSNADRRAATREALLAAARRLFAEKGYAATGTPEIVAEAAVTRGALYHHFAGKADLFRAVVEREQAAIATEIEAASGPDGRGPVEALVAGGEAFLDAMADPGRQRILLIDAPAVLGREAVAAIDGRHAGRTLAEGIAAAVAAGALAPVPAAAVTDLLDAAYDRAALALLGAGRAAARDYRAAIRALVEGLAAAPTRRAPDSSGRSPPR